MTAVIEQLLEQSRPHRPRRLASRELRVEAVAAAAFLATATAMAVLIPWRVPAPAAVLALFVAMYVLVSRIRVYIGAGYTVPTQLVLVPILLTLPSAVAPLLVACGLGAGALLDVARGRAHPERLITSTGDAWHAVGPALVLAVAGDPLASFGRWPVFLGAFAAQCAVDVAAATAREWAGRGILPTLQLRVMASVYEVDALLSPVGLLAAVVVMDRGALSALLIVPLAALLGVFARDRRARIEQALARAQELDRERARLQSTIRRVGEAFASTLDGAAQAQLVVATAADALQASFARISVRLRPADVPAEATAGATPDGFDDVLEAAERAAQPDGRPVAVADRRARAMAVRLRRRDTGDTAAVGRLSVVRLDRDFSVEERELLSYLAGQVAVSIENAALHEELRRQAVTDELTGLANHRHFQETLDGEVERARRSGVPLSLALLDIDRFKQVNDTHGHQQGDLVLQAVATALRTRSRRSDEPARYGGEEFAVVLPATGIDDAYRAAEALRRAVEDLDVPLPDGGLLGVTASFGVAELDPGTDSKASLVAAADAALYEAKRTGRNRTMRADATGAPRFAR
jgi:diguanylate cyclase (GGDEF)-like protein